MTSLNLFWFAYSSSIDNPKLIYTSDGSVMALQGICSINLPHLTLDHILHVPKLTASLLFSQLANLGSHITFTAISSYAQSGDKLRE